ncbi:hypothetical protein A0H81_08800 [Grifola frondosa]|uniref:Uncharacterized protein n=1 Tax=Grifola frondosa TaxID=5627 RepID=A0A1C7M2W6_GRIFR|nr:hypothetical protein A0H81_08800 [Grifola frondosa]
MHDQPRALPWDFHRSRYVSVIAAAFAAHPLHAQKLRSGKMAGRANLVPNFSPEAFASQIIASHPSIRYIVIKVNHTKPLFWKVTTTESGEITVDKTPEEDISLVMDF